MSFFLVVKLRMRVLYYIILVCLSLHIDFLIGGIQDRGSGLNEAGEGVEDGSDVGGEGGVARELGEVARDGLDVRERLGEGDHALAERLRVLGREHGRVDAAEVVGGGGGFGGERRYAGDELALARVAHHRLELARNLLHPRHQRLHLLHEVVGVARRREHHLHPAEAVHALRELGRHLDEVVEVHPDRPIRRAAVAHEQPLARALLVERAVLRLAHRQPWRDVDQRLRDEPALVHLDVAVARDDVRFVVDLHLHVHLFQIRAHIQHTPHIHPPHPHGRPHLDPARHRKRKRRLVTSSPRPIQSAYPAQQHYKHPRTQEHEETHTPFPYAASADTKVAQRPGEALPHLPPEGRALPSPDGAAAPARAGTCPHGGRCA
mmetsp:Transcript_12474/g.41073  ORF Transcript_12474/g.41073 Transcript_12474/m.41073 type:complete len:377 (+) Transcript_12474:890-2020(+)